jgi:hypothetical protein
LHSTGLGSNQIWALSSSLMFLMNLLIILIPFRVASRVLKVAAEDRSPGVRWVAPASTALMVVVCLLGAIGVVASLVYLATQIRHGQEQMSQNTRAMRAATFQQFDQTLSDAFSNLLNAPGASRALRRGSADYSQLDEDERWLFGAWISGMLMRVSQGLRTDARRGPDVA